MMIGNIANAMIILDHPDDQRSKHLMFSNLQTLGVGERGEIVLRGEGCMLGYRSLL